MELDPALQAYVRLAASRYGVPLDLALAVIAQESGGDQGARSEDGAIGIMQLMPGTAEELGVDPTDPYQNIAGGLRYLAQQYERFGTWPLALAAYNAGPGAVQRYNGIPPFAETQQYVPEVLARLGTDVGPGEQLSQSDPAMDFTGMGSNFDVAALVDSLFPEVDIPFLRPPGVAMTGQMSRMSPLSRLGIPGLDSIDKYSTPLQMRDGGEVPRRTEIMGQDHMLAYIRPDEAALLQDLGGAGTPGPGGIPQFALIMDDGASKSTGTTKPTSTKTAVLTSKEKTLAPVVTTPTTTVATTTTPTTTVAKTTTTRLTAKERLQARQAAKKAAAKAAEAEAALAPVVTTPPAAPVVTTPAGPRVADTSAAGGQTYYPPSVAELAAQEYGVGETGDINLTADAKNALGIDPLDSYTVDELTNALAPETSPSGAVAPRELSYAEIMGFTPEQVAEMIAAPVSGGPSVGDPMTNPLDITHPDMSDTSGTLVSGVARGMEIVGSGIQSLFEAIAPQDVVTIGYGDRKIDPSLAAAAGHAPNDEIAVGKPNPFSRFGAGMADAFGLLADRALRNTSEANRAAAVAPLYDPETGEINWSALSTQALLTLPSTVMGLSGAAAGLPGLMIAGGLMQAGETAQDTLNRIDAAYKNGELGDISLAQLEAMKSAALQSNAPMSFATGALTNAIYGAPLSIPGRIGFGILEGAVDEGLLEPTIAQTAANFGMGQGGLEFDVGSLNELVLGGLYGGAANPFVGAVVDPVQTTGTLDFGEEVPGFGDTGPTGPTGSAPSGPGIGYDMGQAVPAITATSLSLPSPSKSDVLTAKESVLDPTVALSSPSPTISQLGAQEIIFNEIAETGGLSLETAQAIQQATGLSLSDIGNIAADASIGPSTDSNLMDEVTGVGGGSPIQVIPNFDGTTTLVNNATGAEAVVEANRNLDEAIQRFDEITTPLTPSEELLADVAPSDFEIGYGEGQVDPRLAAALAEVQAVPEAPAPVEVPVAAPAPVEAPVAEEAPVVAAPEPPPVVVSEAPAEPLTPSEMSLKVVLPTTPVGSGLMGIGTEGLAGIGTEGLTDIGVDTDTGVVVKTQDTASENVAENVVDDTGLEVVVQDEANTAAANNVTLDTGVIVKTTPSTEVVTEGSTETEVYIHEGEILGPETEVSTDVTPTEEGVTIEGEVVEDPLSLTEVTTEPVTEPTTPAEPGVIVFTDTVDGPSEDDGVTVEIPDDTVPGDVTMDAGPEDGGDLSVEIGLGDEGDVSSEAPFECPDGFIAAKMGGRWVCQPKVSRTVGRPTLATTPYLSRRGFAGLNPNTAGR